jgi:ABC-type phosphate transport system substrate-binding protein
VCRHESRKVNGILPTLRSIVSRSYALRRPLYILTPKKPKPEVRKFIDFVLSRDGQAFIRSQGVVSLLDMK